ncbi:MAG: ABC transporter permease [Clostridium sp.]
MRLMRLTLINMKRQLKNPAILLLSLVMPMVMMMSSNGVNSKGEENSIIGSIGIIDNSNSAYSAKLTESLSKRYNITNMVGENEKTSENVRTLIMDDKLTVVYEIPEDFQETMERGQVPEIKGYKTEATTGTIIAEDIITNYINNKVQERVSEGLSTNAIVTEITTTSKDKSTGVAASMALMLCYFMFMGGSAITEELIKLKSQKVLRRTISTANTDKQVLGSLFLSSFLLQGMLSSAGFIFLKVFLNLEHCNLPLIIFVLFLGSLISTAVIVATTRWIKNPILASLFVVIYGLVNFGLGTFGAATTSIENVPAVLINLGLTSPFAWLSKILNAGEILIPTLVIILMSLVFFTAGSFRLRDFAKE